MTYRLKSDYNYSDGFLTSSVLDHMDSGNSDRVNGKLILKENSMSSRKELFTSGPPLSTTYNGRIIRNSFVNYVLPSVSSGASQKAAAAFYDSAGDLRINVLQAFAEKQMTIDLVSDSAQRIAKSFLALRRGRFSDAARHLGGGKPRTPLQVRNGISNNWLALQYGWKPLLQDVYGAMIVTVPRPTSFPIRVSKQVREPIEGKTRDSSDDEYYTRYSGLQITRSTIKAEFVVNNSAVRDFSVLGIDNPLLVAWELVPYSFVIDWFLPIGNYLESLTALNGLTLIKGSTTNSRQIWIHGESHFNPKRGYGWPGIPINSQQDFDLYLSNGSRQLSIPGRPLPRFKNPLSIGHMLNSLALLNNVFSNRKKR